jgi:hypothetical protein
MKVTKKGMLGLALAALTVGLIGVAAAQEATPADKAAMKESFQARHAEMLARFDSNHDGKLDAAERKVMHDTLSAERFKKLDTNGDGVLSLAEFQAARGPGSFHHHHRGDDTK